MTDTEAYLKYQKAFQTPPGTSLFIELDSELEIKRKQVLFCLEIMREAAYRCMINQVPYIVINRFNNREVIAFVLKSLSRAECIHTGRVESSVWVDRKIDMKKIAEDFRGLKKFLES